ncbi:hypothetical protein HRTV-25_gp38 [Halorubrum tailed virus 25]|uniref:Uncharacterized protein n=1 Tax=Halorubrum tailed virus 25 TaxID=2878006 RepID=A0AAE8XYW4_9CAUD|nr:hypothetical protein M1M37_gp038 [Halorubrum tailed virus 25]UBF22619.1 hypothetical protein HRTV-25_gp38 [Halorubrum tailed virus 25]
MGGFASRCKECGSENVQPVGGCPVCLECGWSACG